MSRKSFQPSPIALPHLPHNANCTCTHTSLFYPFLSFSLYVCVSFLSLSLFFNFLSLSIFLSVSIFLYFSYRPSFFLSIFHSLSLPYPSLFPSLTLSVSHSFRLSLIPSPSLSLSLSLSNFISLPLLLSFSFVFSPSLANYQRCSIKLLSLCFQVSVDILSFVLHHFVSFSMYYIFCLFSYFVLPSQNKARGESEYWNPVCIQMGWLFRCCRNDGC